VILNDIEWLSKISNDMECPATSLRQLSFLFIFLSCQRSKVKDLDTCLTYSAGYMSQTGDQQRLTISEVAADWHEPVVPQSIMWPSIARANGQLDPRCTLGLHPRSRSYYSFPVPLRVGGLLKVACSESNPQPYRLRVRYSTVPLDHCTHCRYCSCYFIADFTSY